MKPPARAGELHKVMKYMYDQICYKKLVTNDCEHEFCHAIVGMIIELDEGAHLVE